MGRRGPPPLPSKLKELNGNPGKRPINKNEPQPVTELRPIPPAWMSEDALEIWQALSINLVPLGLLSVIDKGTFGRYCEVFAEWLKAKRFIQEHGATYPVYENIPTLDGNGRPRLNQSGEEILQRHIKYVAQFPQVSMFRNLAIEMRQLESEFGLTPASRSRIQLDGPTGKIKSTKRKEKFKYNSRS